MSETTAAATGGDNTTTTTQVADTTSQNTTTQANATSQDWTATLPEELKGYVTTKGFKDPSAVLESYRNYEKLMGVPKERILKLPENMEDPTSMTELYTKLGRPATPDGYKFDGEEADPEFSKFAKSTFHELGLSEKQAKALLTKFGEYDKVSSEAEAKKEALELEAQDKALKTEWGAAHAERIAMAKNAVQRFGVKADVLDKLEKSIGYPEVMKLMYEIGSKLGEATFNSGDGARHGFTLTPAEAKNQIDMLKADPEFAKKLTNKDAASVEKWNKLHSQAYPS